LNLTLERDAEWEPENSDEDRELREDATEERTVISAVAEGYYFARRNIADNDVGNGNGIISAPKQARTVC